METLVARLSENVGALLEKIEEACAKAGRPSGEVGLIAVTKYATAVETAALARAMHAKGLRVLLGESRVQALTQKAAALVEVDLPIDWELIGNLQRNKAKLALVHAQRIHSLDRDEILRTLSELAVRRGSSIRGLLQVNISEEATKHGYPPEGLPAALDLASSLPGLEIEGLMGMAGQRTDHETARSEFAKLRELRDEHAPHLPHLSMGMSQDYIGAILEGATLLRIGSVLFATTEN